MEIGQRLGVKKSYLSDVENNRKRLSLEKALILARVYEAEETRAVKAWVESELERTGFSCSRMTIHQVPHSIKIPINYWGS